MFDAIIIGAGAAGLMCGIHAGKRGRKILVLDHAKKPAEKIRISGGGRCNFTNLYTKPEHFISQNKHFCKSALMRYTQHDFIKMIESYRIKYHEKKLGQLFCDISANDIIKMLIDECDKNNVIIKMNTKILSVSQSESDTGFIVTTDDKIYQSASLVVASGGLSIPKIGATGIGYDIAKQFNMAVTQTYPALVPLIFNDSLQNFCKNLSGIALDAVVSTQKTRFRENILFTHQGLSGPAILQISSYWTPKTPVHINMLPDADMISFLRDKKKNNPKQEIHTIISEILPKNLAIALCDLHHVTGRIADLSDKILLKINDNIHNWTVIPSGTQGYRTAEVTLGGVDTGGLSSQTMESKTTKGLFFIGEVVDVTGHLGGFNFQWAWASGYVAGQYI